MLRALLLTLFLFQAGAQTAPKPVIDNERVAVFDVTSAAAQPTDAVVVSFSGKATFLPKGDAPKLDGRSLIINLKETAPAITPVKNTSGYPLAFPRPGIKKLFENARAIVWDYTWEPNVPTPMHFHDKDVVVLFLEDGDLKSTEPDGKSVVNAYTAATVRFNKRDRTHSETLVRGKERALITELK
ncbi:MAG TPA: hypothetical protein VFL42_10105 [Terriglobales bacterium]|nr:hypothetical protein [Terriglobales bacterium]